MNHWAARLLDGRPGHVGTIWEEGSRTYEGELATRGKGAENNMSNFINGRERLWLPKLSVKDRKGRRRRGEGEMREGTTGREMEGGVSDAKCERERGQSGWGLTVNGCTGGRANARKGKAGEIKRWRGQISHQLSEHLYYPFSLALPRPPPSSISVSYQASVWYPLTSD